MKTGIELIVAARKNQIENLGYTLEHDLKHWEKKELQKFARYLISAEEDYFPKGMSHETVRQIFMKPRVQQLAIAAALLAAEIDRLQAEESEDK